METTDWKKYSFNFEMIDNNGSNKINVYFIYSLSKIQAINYLIHLMNKNGYQLKRINNISIVKRP